MSWLLFSTLSYPKFTVNLVEVKFVRQISGLLVTVAHLGNYIFGYLHDIHIGDCIGQNIGGSTINQNKINLKFYKNLMYECKLGAAYFIK